MTSNTISVVIPAFNAAPFIREALESVFAQESDYADVIVVDDGSTDATARLASDLAGVRVISKANGGIGSARNRGIEEATGSYLAMLDADDLWPNGRNAALLAVLSADSGASSVFGRVIEFGEGRSDGPPTAGVLVGSGMFRLADFRKVGLFDESLHLGEFVDWWARAEESGLRHISIDTVTLRRRIHTTNTGLTNGSDRVDYTRVLRAALERRRATQ